jgi:hypothetical protein
MGSRCAGRFHLGIGPCRLRFTYAAPVSDPEVEDEIARNRTTPRGGATSGRCVAGRAPIATRSCGRATTPDPGSGRAVSSWNRSILTEIYLCHACSDHEILREEMARQVHPLAAHHVRRHGLLGPGSRERRHRWHLRWLAPHVPSPRRQYAVLSPESTENSPRFREPACSVILPSWNRSVWTEIYLCHACSDHEVLRVDTRSRYVRDLQFKCMMTTLMTMSGWAANPDTSVAS